MEPQEPQTPDYSSQNHSIYAAKIWKEDVCTFLQNLGSAGISVTWPGIFEEEVS